MLLRIIAAVSIMLISVSAQADYYRFKKKGVSQLQPLPSVSLQSTSFFDGDGKAFNFDQYKGKVVVVSFWATWCKPCVEELPALDQLQEKLKKNNVVILPLSQDFGGADMIANFYREHQIKSLPVLMDKNQSVFQGMGMYALPTNVIIDTNGKAIAKATGYIDWLNDDIQNYLINLAQQ